MIPLPSPLVPSFGSRSIVVVGASYGAASGYADVGYGFCAAVRVIVVVRATRGCLSCGSVKRSKRGREVRRSVFVTRR